MSAQPTATSTTLMVSPVSVTSGGTVTLTATVSGNSQAITSGSVTFYSGLVPLGTAQIIGVTPATGQIPGTAVLVTSFVPGTFSLVAKFNGTSTEEPSTSQGVNLTASGGLPSLTSLAEESATSPYSFSVMASGSGSQPIAGAVELFDSTASSVLGSLSIDASQLQSGLSVKTSFQVGQKPVSIVSGDFNHDGIPDLAVANYASGTVSVLLGNASGGFTLEQTLQVGNGPCALATADFNGDGVPDLAVLNASDNTLVIFLGNPDQPGTFVTMGSSTTVGWTPAALAVNDFNADGVLDIAVANYWDNTVTILLGNSSDPGTFTVNQTISVGHGPIALASADFNGDGIPDLAVASFNDNQVWVLTGDPQHPGQFVSPKYVSATGPSPTSLAVADFNNDGVPDLAVSNSGDGTVSILWGVSGLNGVFPTQQILDVGEGPESVTVGDFNNDGIPDIAVANAGDGTIGILINQGGGDFQSLRSYQVGMGPRQVIPWSVSSCQSPGIASVDIDAGTATVFAQGSTFSGSFNKQSMSGTGIHQIEAMYLPNGQSPYAKSTSNAIALNLGQGSGILQTITFPALQPVTYGTSPVSLMASASSGLPISYKVVSGPATIEGAQLTLSGAGNVVVEADQGGNNTYAAATPAQQALTVNKGALVVTPANATRYYDQRNPEFTGTISGAVPNDNITATYESAATTTTPVGSYSVPPYGISATLLDPLDRLNNYIVTAETGSLTILSLSMNPRPTPSPILGPQGPILMPPGHPIRPPGPTPGPPGPVPILPIPIFPIGPTPTPAPPTGPARPPNRTPGPPGPILGPTRHPTRPPKIGRRPIEPRPVRPFPVPPSLPRINPPLRDLVYPLDWTGAIVDGAISALSSRKSHRATATLYLAGPSQVMNSGGEVTLSVVARSTKRPRPSGYVTIWDGERLLKALELDKNGRASLDVTTLDLGTHLVKATYIGDERFRPAVTQAMRITVYSPATLFHDQTIPTNLALQSDRATGGESQLMIQDCGNIWFALSCSKSKTASSCSAREGGPNIAIKWW